MATSEMTDSVLVVIVNYRTADLTIECLRSLAGEAAKFSEMSVVVTDNHSEDDSVERIGNVIDQEGFSNWVSLVPLTRNGGFAYGNNAAIRPVLESDNPPKYVLLLNPDTILRPDAVTTLIKFMNENRQVGIAGSRLEDPDGSPQRSAFRFPTVASELDRAMRWGPVSRLLRRFETAPPVSNHDVPTSWVAGASMIIRREVFETIGLLDEGYFMYFEEVDFCLRAARAGWPCWYVPESRVVHLVGQASGVTDTKVPAKRRPKYWFDSRRRYFLRNRGRWYTAACDAAFIAGFSLWRFRRLVQRKPDTDPPRMLSDFFRNSVFAKGFST